MSLNDRDATYLNRLSYKLTEILDHLNDGAKGDKAMSLSEIASAIASAQEYSKSIQEYLAAITGESDGKQ